MEEAFRGIYLDHQATTPPCAEAVAAMMRHLSMVPGNPHSFDHAAGWAASAGLEEARVVIAGRIGAESEDLVFTSGATEANNLALIGIASGGAIRTRVVVSAIEHRSVLGPARELRRRGMELVVVPCRPDGVVDADQFAAAVDERTLVASLMLVNNETGAVQPVPAIAERCRSVGALLHVDAVQALRWLPIDVADLGCTSLSVSSHKVGGPTGIGALWVDTIHRASLRPLYHGGEQEDGLRPGTVPGFLAAGFAAAIERLPDRGAIEAWRAATERLLLALRHIDDRLILNGPRIGRHPGSLNLRLPDVEAGLVIALLQPAAAVSQGSACSSGLSEPSHVLTAMGLNAGEAARSLRISTAPATSKAELDAFVAAFASAVERARLAR